MSNLPLALLSGFAAILLLLAGCNLYFLYRHRKNAQAEQLRREQHAAAQATLEKRNREIALLYEAGKSLGRSLHPQTVYRTVYRVIRDAMDCNTLIISSFDPETEQIFGRYVLHNGEEHDVSGFPPLPLEPAGTGTQSKVIRTGESMILNDMRKLLPTLQSRFHVDDDGNVVNAHEENVEDEALSSLLFPLVLENQVTGVVQVQSNRVNAFTADDLRFLEALGPQIAAATHNASLFAQAQEEIAQRVQAQEAEREQRMFAEAMLDAVIALNSTFDLEEQFEKLIQIITRVIPYDGINLALFDAGTARIVRYRGIYAKYATDKFFQDLTLSVADTPNIERMVETGEPVLIGDVQTEPNWVAYPQLDWIRSHVGAPIFLEDTIIGALHLDGAQPEYFTEAQARLLQAFANYAAIAIHNARLYQELAAHNATLEQAVSARTAELQYTVDQVNVILNNSPDAMLLLNVEGKVTRRNPASMALFNWMDMEQDVLLHNYLLPDDAKRFLKSLRDVVAHNKSTRFDVIARRADDGRFDAEIALAPVSRNGVVVGIICNVHDISNLKEVERMKDAFVSNVSHELRTPIASLRLHHDLMNRSPANLAKYMVRMRREIDRLNVIIEDLLQLSRLDQRRVDVKQQEFTLETLLQEYVTDRQMVAEDKGVQLVWMPGAPTPPVYADASLMGQVLSILLTNAVNYTPRNGRVELSAVSMRKAGQTWVGFVVKDDGLGVPPSEQARIFDRFYRGSSGENSGAPGTGLGLSIAQQIVTQHHGYIELQSSGIPGEGAAFTVWLPAATPSASYKDYNGAYTRPFTGRLS